jgi:hypothetical protein
VVDGHVERRQHLFQFEFGGVDAAVAGHGHAHVVAQGADGLGQRAGYVGQAAGLGKGDHLGGEDQNLE